MKIKITEANDKILWEFSDNAEDLKPQLIPLLTATRIMERSSSALTSQALSSGRSFSTSNTGGPL